MTNLITTIGHSHNAPSRVAELITAVSAADMSDDAQFTDMMKGLFGGSDPLLASDMFVSTHVISDSSFMRWVEGISAPRVLERKKEVRKWILDILEKL